MFRVIVENDLMPARNNGKIRMASAFKRKRIKTPSGRVELRVVRPGFREVLEDITIGPRQRPARRGPRPDCP